MKRQYSMPRRCGTVSMIAIGVIGVAALMGLAAAQVRALA